MQTIHTDADIVVQGADGNVLALVEVKNRQGLAPDIAASLRRNLIIHSGVNLRSRFFLIVSQDFGYLWDQDSPSLTEEPLPAVGFPMNSVVEHYLPSFVGGTRLSSSQLELAVAQWLWDLAHEAEDRPREPDIGLAKTDFLRLIKGGRVGTEVER